MSKFKLLAWDEMAPMLSGDTSNLWLHNDGDIEIEVEDYVGGRARMFIPLIILKQYVEACEEYQRSKSP